MIKRINPDPKYCKSYKTEARAVKTIEDFMASSDVFKLDSYVIAAVGEKFAPVVISRGSFSIYYAQNGFMVTN